MPGSIVSRTYEFVSSRTAVAMAVCTALLCMAALFNGYPLLYTDTGTYVQQALALRGAPDRPPYYSIAILPLHLGVSLWPVVIGQALVTALLLAELAKILFGGTALRVLVPTVAGLTFLTSLPWHTGQIMADLATPLLLIAMAIVVLGAEQNGRIWKAVLWLGITGAITMHQANLLLAAGMTVVWLVLMRIGLVGQYSNARLRFVALYFFSAIAVAALAFVLYSMALVRKPVLSPMGNVFLFARIVADGPGLSYLKESCPKTANVFCPYVNDFGSDSDDILWRSDSPLAQAIDQAGFDRVVEDAGTVVRNTVLTRPLTLIGNGSYATFRQLGSFATLDANCPSNCGPASSVHITIKDRFPREYASFTASRQMNETLPVTFLRVVHTVVVCMAVIGLALLMWRRGTQDRVMLALAIATVAGLVINAGLLGALGGVFDRYQSRVIWLVPLIAVWWAVHAYGWLRGPDESDARGHNSP